MLTKEQFNLFYLYDNDHFNEKQKILKEKMNLNNNTSNVFMNFVF